VQKSNNMTMTPVIPMAAQTGFGTSTETTMTTASAAKSKPVETKKADQVSEETEAPTAPTAPSTGETTGGWVSTFAEIRAGLSERKKAIVDAHSQEIIATFTLLDQRNAQHAQQAATYQQAEAVAETNKHVSLLEVGCELSDSEPEKN
jgi:hypothetical protein